MVTNEELYNALITIRQLCDETAHCEECPLSNPNGQCILNSANKIPAEWNVQPPPRRIYCAIKID